MSPYTTFEFAYQMCTFLTFSIWGKLKNLPAARDVLMQLSSDMFAPTKISRSVSRTSPFVTAHIGTSPIEDWQIERMGWDVDPEDQKISGRYKRFRTENYTQFERWPQLMESVTGIKVFRQYSKLKVCGLSPYDIDSIAQIEDDAGTSLTYDQVPDVLLMLQHVISVRSLYDDCDTIKVMCHDKNHNEQGMECVLGAVKQALLRNQTVIKDGSKVEKIGLLYVGAKLLPGWIQDIHVSIWLAPILTSVARVAFKGLKGIIGCDTDCTDFAHGNIDNFVRRHIGPVAHFHQMTGEIAAVLIDEPHSPCNYGLVWHPATSPAARAKAGSNIMFEDIDAENCDANWLEASIRAVKPDQQQQWPPP